MRRAQVRQELLHEEPWNRELMQLTASHAEDSHSTPSLLDIYKRNLLPSCACVRV